MNPMACTRIQSFCRYAEAKTVVEMQAGITPGTWRCWRQPQDSDLWLLRFQYFSRLRCTCDSIIATYGYTFPFPSSCSIFLYALLHGTLPTTLTFDLLPHRSLPESICSCRSRSSLAFTSLTSCWRESMPPSFVQFSSALSSVVSCRCVCVVCLWGGRASSEIDEVGDPGVLAPCLLYLTSKVQD